MIRKLFYWIQIHKIQRKDSEIYILKITAALVTIAERQKPPKYPLTEEEIKCGVCVQWNINQC